MRVHMFVEYRKIRDNCSLFKQQLMILRDLGLDARVTKFEASITFSQVYSYLDKIYIVLIVL